MKRRVSVIVLFMFVAGVGTLAAQGLDFSGTLESWLVGTVGAGAAPDFSMGFEVWANIRFQAALRDFAAIYGAVNLIAASGSIAKTAADMAALSPGPFPATAFVGGENFAAALELERLYFRVKGEALQLDTGLLRIPLGYSLVWGPSDFLNPRSPLRPDARLRGVLGASFLAYPTDTTKIFAFASAPKNPLNAEGQGYNTGIGADKHWDKCSIQGFYAFETPGLYHYGRHRGGLSLKADVEVGLTAEALYSGDPAANNGIEGLSGAAGIDYSFFSGNLTASAEYLYSGKKSSTAENLGLKNNHYLALTALYRINDYTRLNFSLMSGFEDISFLPTLGAEWEPFQGMTVSLSCQIPLDHDTFAHDGNSGELGPQTSQSHAIITLKARLKF